MFLNIQFYIVDIKHMYVSRQKEIGYLEGMGQTPGHLRVITGRGVESLYSCVGGLSLLEHDLLVLRQDLQTMAQKQMSRGAAQSMETLGENR